ncbi:hypothetical protein ACO0K9_10955 [Undibacterium sp. Ji50W]|uniref:hypothetical protein n=1 Tax=Undibacterium sp. Ji50W TaxID=3413041 RepID=UPI003BEFA775
MPEHTPGILLIDADPALQARLAILLHALPQRLCIAAGPAQARRVMAEQRISLLIAEPADAGVANFMQDMHETDGDMVSLILTAHPEHPQVLQVLNRARPYRLLIKPVSDAELLGTVRQALEHAVQQQEQQRLLREYQGILANAEGAHAFRVLDALMHSIHKDMAADAIHHLPVGALLLVNDCVSLSNAPARRFLQEMEETPAEPGISLAHLPAALQDAPHAPRRQRLQHRTAINRRVDYFVLELTAGTLIAFAPEPSLGRPPDT